MFTNIFYKEPTFMCRNLLTGTPMNTGDWAITGNTTAAIVLIKHASPVIDCRNVI